ncbi:MAG: EamA family transporter [Elusimicrobia bacterium]|nr:EamA family transporter [Elusimicrobiota bacterium]
MELSTIIFLVLAIIAWGSGAFLDKMTLRYVDASGAFYIRTLFMLILFIPFLAWKYIPARYALLNSNKLASVYILSSVVVTMGGVFFYLKAMSGGEASKIVPLSSTYPFITFALAMFFLGENFTLNKLMGTLLISGGIYFISK